MESASFTIAGIKQGLEQNGILIGKDGDSICIDPETGLHATGMKYLEANSLIDQVRKAQNGHLEVGTYKRFWRGEIKDGKIENLQQIGAQVRVEVQETLRS